MKTLNEVTRRYLKANGISNVFFADYIGADQTVCSRWLHGKYNLNASQIQRTHDFLSGRYLKNIEDIMQEMGDE